MIVSRYEAGSSGDSKIGEMPSSLAGSAFAATFFVDVALNLYKRPLSGPVATVSLAGSVQRFCRAPLFVVAGHALDQFITLLSLMIPTALTAR